MKRFKDYQPYQMYLLPPSLRDWLPEDHLVYFILETMGKLDLSGIYRSYEGTKGQPPFSPEMMTAVWLYGYTVNIRSCRRLEKALYEDVSFRVLSGNQQPDHWTLNQFRRRHLAVLANLFRQTVWLAQQAGLVKLGHVAIDGTKIKANASKHHAMSYARMQEEDRRLREDIERYFREVDENDAKEDEEYGTQSLNRVPPHLADPRIRQKVIADAMRRLEEQAREEAREQEAQERKKAEKQDQKTQKKRKSRRRKKPEQARPSPKAQLNFTDPESRIMKNSDKAFIQGYNGQVAVDASSQIIVAAELTNQAADCSHLPPLLKQIQEFTDALPQEVSADAGYWSQENLEALNAAGIEAFIPPDRVRHTQWRTQVAPRGRIPQDITPTDRMRRKLKTRKGRERYELRMCTVEPVLGQIKEVRGLRQFSLRGLFKVRCSWLLDCAAHNLLKLFRAQVRFQSA